jgi:hypothetical protein
MTAKELIKRLQKLDPNAEISVRHMTYGEWGSFDARSKVTGVVARKHGAMLTCKREFEDTGAIT